MQLFASSSAASETHELLHELEQHVASKTRQTNETMSSSLTSQPMVKAEPAAHGECEHVPMSIVQVLVPP